MYGQENLKKTKVIIKSRLNYAVFVSSEPEKSEKSAYFNAVKIGITGSLFLSFLF